LIQANAHENGWPKAVHRVAADGISPEQQVDEAQSRPQYRAEH
jgi:hypothetical protein